MLQATAITQKNQMETVPRSRMVEAAHEFESQLMKELLRPMINASDEDDSQAGFGGALAEFAGEALGKALSARGGFGIASSILQSFSRSGNVRSTYSAPGNVSLGDEIGLK